jgi:hypothetical protein
LRVQEGATVDIHIDVAHFHITGPSTEDIEAAVRAVLTPLLEEHTMSEAELIGALDAKVTDLIADVRAALAALAADRDNLGPDGQAALDTLTAKVDAFDAEVGDGDGSDTPPAPVE